MDERVRRDSPGEVLVVGEKPGRISPRELIERRSRGDVIALPPVATAPGVVVEAGLLDGKVVHVVAVEASHSSSSAVREALERASAVARGLPEKVDRVELRTDRHTNAALIAAAEKRRRRARRGW